MSSKRECGGTDDLIFLLKISGLVSIQSNGINSDMYFDLIDKAFTTDPPGTVIEEVGPITQSGQEMTL